MIVKENKPLVLYVHLYYDVPHAFFNNTRAKTNVCVVELSIIL